MITPKQLGESLFDSTQVICQVALGLTSSSADAKAFPQLFEAVLDELNKRMFQPWRAFMPLELFHRRRIAELNNIILTTITHRRARRAALAASAELKAPDSSAFLGSAVVNANAAEFSEDMGAQIASGAGAGLSATGQRIFENGCDMLDVMLDSTEALTDQQILDDTKTQLLAGHETSSMMLTWSCWLLARHPEAMAKAVAEVDAKLGITTGHGFDAFKDLEYIGCVLKEAMRSVSGRAIFCYGLSVYSAAPIS